VQEAGTNNWGGYIMWGDDSSGNGHYTAIQSYIWIPPESSFSGPTGSEASFWIGMGGTGPGFLGDTPTFPFWQAGVDVILPNTVQLWYEGFQSSSDFEKQQHVTSSVTFGRVVELQLEFTSGGLGYVCFTIVDWQDCLYDSLLSGDYNANTAEWVVEAPLNAQNEETILPDFGPVNFTKMVLAPNAGQISQQALETCYGGASCEDSGQTVTPPPFYTGDFSRGFNVAYSGST